MRDTIKARLLSLDNPIINATVQACTEYGDQRLDRIDDEVDILMEVVKQLHRYNLALQDAAQLKLERDLTVMPMVSPINEKGEEVPEMTPRMTSTTAYLTHEQFQRLKEVSEESKIPMAEFIRHGVDLALDEHEAKHPHPIQQQAGMNPTKGSRMK